MALKINSDEAYLSAPKSRSCVGGIFLLGNYTNLKYTYMHNRAILIISDIIKKFMFS